MKSLTTTLTEAINARLSENKKGLKFYKSFSAAESYGSKVAEEVGQMHMTYPARFIVLEVPRVGFVPCIDVTEVLGRPDACGGYVFHAASKGFMQY